MVSSLDYYVFICIAKQKITSIVLPSTPLVDTFTNSIRLSFSLLCFLCFKYYKLSVGDNAISIPKID